MPIPYQHLVLYGLYLNHGPISCGTTGGDDNKGKYYKQLVTEYIDEDVITTGSSDCSGLMEFLYPELIESGYLINGIIDGHFKLYNTAVSAGTLSYYYCFLWAKNPKDEKNYIAYQESPVISYSIASHDIIGFPIRMYADRKFVAANEKLILTIYVYEYGGATFDLMHFNDPNYNDLMIDIPLAIEEYE